jgi:hypothetical protein
MYTKNHDTHFKPRKHWVKLAWSAYNNVSLVDVARIKEK